MLILDTGIETNFHPDQFTTAIVRRQRDSNPSLNYEHWDSYNTDLVKISISEKYVPIGYQGEIAEDAYTTGFFYKKYPLDQEVDSDDSIATINDMVEKVKAVFGVNSVQISKILGISRPSLYNHISGKESPVSIDTYRRLYDIAVSVEQDKEISSEINKYVRSVLVDGETLLSYLENRGSDAEIILNVSRKISEKIKNNVLPNGLPVSRQREITRGLTKAG